MNMKDREKAFENKFAHDADLKFKAESRRNKMLAQWAAGLLGNADVDAYVKEVIAADFEEAGDEDVFRKIRGDLDAGGISGSDDEIRTKMLDLMDQAVAEVQND